MNAPGSTPSGEQPIFQAMINQLRFRKFTRDLNPPRLSFPPATEKEEEEKEGSHKKARRRKRIGSGIAKKGVKGLVKGGPII